MGAKSRGKGKKGELEVVALARRHDFDARRVAPMQAGHGGDFPDVDGVDPLWIEVKRYRRVPVNALWREFNSDRPGFVNVLAWRDDHEKWAAVLDLEELFKLLRLAYNRGAEW